MKRQYAQEVYALVAQFCAQFAESNDDAIPIVLHVSNDDARAIVNKVLIALPNQFFYNASSSILYDMLAFISKNLLLFQAQENIDEEVYGAHLVAFINGLILAIQDRYYP